MDYRTESNLYCATLLVYADHQVILVNIAQLHGINEL